MKYTDALLKIYNVREAHAVFYRLMEDKYGLTRADVCLGGIEKLSESCIKELKNDMERLAAGEPVQYVTGVEWFCGKKFHVESGVLIPRPETEMLVDMAKNLPHSNSKRLLDIGCGSGCIAVSLAEDYDVTAWDISETALLTTARNASDNNVKVNVTKQNALDAPTDDKEIWDVIVSNPPYVCDSERHDMERQVTEHEPSLALFVPDSDPLVFYSAIAKYASHALRHGGTLLFEINERFGNEVCSMLSEEGFPTPLIKKDQFGKDRFVITNKTIIHL